MSAQNAMAARGIARVFGVSRLRGTFSRFVRSAGMANSSFGALVLLMLVVAAAVFVLTPHERGSVSFNPPSFWNQR
jgi:hypothetical protein